MYNANLPQDEIRWVLQGLTEYAYKYTLPEIVMWVCDVFGISQAERERCHEVTGLNIVYQRVSAAIEVCRRANEIPRTVRGSIHGTSI